MNDESTVLPTATPPGLWVESLDLEAQGVAHRADGKVVFIEGALPFERVDAAVHRKKNNWEQGTVSQIHSLDRTSKSTGAPASYPFQSPGWVEPWS